MSEDVKLLPCPFCGGTPILHECDWCEPCEYSVICECGALQRGSTDKRIAAGNWNRRDPRARLAALEEAASMMDLLARQADENNWRQGRRGVSCPEALAYERGAAAIRNLRK